MDCLEKSIWYSLANLDNRLSQNVQDTRRRNKVYWEYDEKLVSGIDSRREKLSWGENLERDLPGRCTIAIKICNSDDATESHT